MLSQYKLPMHELAQYNSRTTPAPTPCAPVIAFIAVFDLVLYLDATQTTNATPQLIK